MFYFEVNPDNEFGVGSFEFDTVEGKTISDLMTDYAMAFLKERERQEERMRDLAPLARSKQNGKAGGKSSHEGKEKDAKHVAATKIQALYRGFSLRNEWIKEDAAILVQSVYRGYRARVKLSQVIEQMIKGGQL